ncbi:MAG: aminoacetone oxidase family FAD-binding enzyme [Gemmataceae bacterium]|nr:aminoacetone oxidase family FAD-binding enzyme [Gemmataceae bacterium]
MSVASDPWDVIVIGAGAAGLMAAIHAAERGRRTLVLEKNRKAGVKILMSGGTRCNITHATDNRGIVAAYGPPGKFLHSALAAFSVQDTIDFFAAEGVATKVEETGKIFPVSNKALDVLDALLRRLERSGATLALGEAVTGISGERGGRDFLVETSARALNGDRIILTSGGQSYPGSGTTGDGYRFAAQFGHRIIAPRPALVPLTTNLPWIAELRGITLPDVSVRILNHETQLIARRGSLLFAHFGLSGPVILDVSRVVSGHPQPQTLTLELDLLPALLEADLDEWLRTESLASGKKQLAVVLTQHVPRRLADIVLEQAGLAKDRKAAALTRDERQRLVGAFKHLHIPLTGTLGFKKAEVTAGGVALDEVDSRTMQSKLATGLYLAGEILDLDGPIGGYNFQAAWSTGWLAGASV